MKENERRLSAYLLGCLAVLVLLFWFQGPLGLCPEKYIAERVLLVGETPGPEHELRKICYLEFNEETALVGFFTIFGLIFVVVLLMFFASWHTLRRWNHFMFLFMPIALLLFAGASLSGGGLFGSDPSRIEAFVALTLFWFVISLGLIGVSELIERLWKPRAKEREMRALPKPPGLLTRHELSGPHARVFGIASMATAGAATVSFSMSMVFDAFENVTLSIAIWASIVTIGLIAVAALMVKDLRHSLAFFFIGWIPAALLVFLMIKYGWDFSFIAVILGVPLSVAAVLAIAWSRLVFRAIPPVILGFFIALGMLLLWDAINV